jgi:hypothetical protein
MNKENLNPFEICQNYLDRPKSIYKINKDWKCKIEESLRLMDKIIMKLNEGEDVNDFKFTIIEEVLNLLTSLTFQTKVDNFLTDFIHAYVFLAHNVNENTFKYPGVTKKLQYLQRFTERCLTYSELQNLLKISSSRLLNSKGETPSFRLSAHYYNLLKEE